MKGCKEAVRNFTLEAAALKSGLEEMEAVLSKRIAHSIELGDQNKY